MVGLKIMKRVQESYSGDNNKHSREEINLLLMGLRIMKKVQKTYGKDSNGYLRKKMNLFINKQ